MAESMEPLSEAELTAIQARAALATPGPWHSQQGNNEGVVRAGSAAVAYCRGHEANAEVIAHARADEPALVAEVRRLHDALRDVLWHYEAVNRLTYGSRARGPWPTMRAKRYRPTPSAVSLGRAELGSTVP